MPFFTNNKWIADANRIWVWILLTVPSTTLAFLFYMLWKRKESKTMISDEEETVELNT